MTTKQRPRAHGNVTPHDLRYRKYRYPRKKGFPKHLVLHVMRETKAEKPNAPRAYCSVCKTTWLLEHCNHVVLGVFETGYVCNYCYDSKQYTRV